MREQQGASVSFQRGAWSGGRGKLNGRGEKERGERARGSILFARSLERPRARRGIKSPFLLPLPKRARTLFEVDFGPAEAAAQAVQGLARLAKREAEPRKHVFFFRFVPLFFLDGGGRLGKKKSELLFSFLFPFFFADLVLLLSLLSQPLLPATRIWIRIQVLLFM